MTARTWARVNNSTLSSLVKVTKSTALVSPPMSCVATALGMSNLPFKLGQTGPKWDKSDPIWIANLTFLEQ